MVDYEDSKEDMNTSLSENFLFKAHKRNKQKKTQKSK